MSLFPEKSAVQAGVIGRAEPGDEQPGAVTPVEPVHLEELAAAHVLHEVEVSWKRVPTGCSTLAHVHRAGVTTAFSTGRACTPR